MKKEGYATDFSVCVVASACTKGPSSRSILFIVYGSLVQVLVDQLFLAGFSRADHDGIAHGLRRLIVRSAFSASHARFLVRRAVET